MEADPKLLSLNTFQSNFRRGLPVPEAPGQIAAEKKALWVFVSICCQISLSNELFQTDEFSILLLCL